MRRFCDQLEAMDPRDSSLADPPAEQLAPDYDPRFRLAVQIVFWLVGIGLAMGLIQQWFLAMGAPQQ